MSADIIDELVEALKILPGVGLKSAQRMAFFLLTDKTGKASKKILDALHTASSEVQLCKRCRNFSTEELCDICSSCDRGSICVVKNMLDLLMIKKSGQHNGGYFVLHKYLSPIDGIYPEDIGIPELVHIVKDDNIKEIILALANSVEGEMTAHFIEDKFVNQDIKISRLAKGIPLGTDIEYIDANTLSVAFVNRK